MSISVVLVDVDFAGNNETNPSRTEAIAETAKTLNNVTAIMFLVIFTYSLHSNNL